MLSNKHLFILSVFSLFCVFPKFAASHLAINTTSQSYEALISYPTRDVPAHVISSNNAVISAETNGVVLALPFQIGQAVTKGDIIALLDCQDYQLNSDKIAADIKATEAKVRFIEWQLKKMSSLAQNNNISQETLKELEMNRAISYATLAAQNTEQKKAALLQSRCEVKAPFGGIVMEIFTHQGEQAMAGTRLIRLIDTVQIEVSAQLLPSELSSLDIDSSIFFETDQEKYPVKIRSIVGAHHQQTKSRELRAVFCDKKPLPGAIGRLVWQSHQAHLPSHLLSRYENQLGVFIAKENKATFVPIPSAMEGRPIPLPHRFSADIILDGRYNLTDNADIINQPA